MQFPAVTDEVSEEGLVVFAIGPIVMDQRAHTPGQAPGYCTGLLIGPGTDGVEFRGLRVERVAYRAV